MTVGHNALHMNGAHWLVLTEGLFLLVVVLPIVAALATYPARSVRRRGRVVLPPLRTPGSQASTRSTSIDLREPAVRARALHGRTR